MKKIVDIIMISFVALFLILAICSAGLSFFNQYQIYKQMKELQSEPEIFEKTWECREQKDGDMICYRIRG